MNHALTSGTPWRVMIRFAIPLLIGNVVQQMYQVADAMVVGQHLGVDALAAVGATNGILFLLIGFAQGMTQGFAIPTAQAFGAGDARGVRRSVAAGTILTAVASLVLMVGAPLIIRPFLGLLRTPPELIDQAVTFATVNFLGVAALMFFNYLSAIIRAIGDSRTPLVFLVIACLLNVALVVLFVQVMDLGVGGAALATVIAQLTSALLCLGYLVRSIEALHVGRADWRVGAAALGRQLKIGLPMGFQQSIIAIGTLAVQVSLNGLGATAVAAYTTATRVDGLAVAFLMSLGLAVSTFTAQNLGAGYTERIKTGVRQALVMSFVVSLFLSVTLVSAGNPIVRSFVGSGEETVVAMAHEYLVINGTLYVVLGVLFVTRSALQGLGRTLIPTLAGVLELAMRVSAAVVLSQVLGFQGIVSANPLAWIGASMLLVPAGIVARRKLPADVRGLKEVPFAEGQVEVTFPPASDRLLENNDFLPSSASAPSKESDNQPQGQSDADESKHSGDQVVKGQNRSYVDSAGHEQENQRHDDGNTGEGTREDIVHHGAEPLPVR
ncbi:MAG: MATE family efflux transporter [Ancrocorticia sp.]|nr:MATE family efflux transporter [Ancrocorticia sp.]